MITYLHYYRKRMKLTFGFSNAVKSTSFASTSRQKVSNQSENISSLKFLFIYNVFHLNSGI